jgi:hypothetical protein
MKDNNITLIAYPKQNKVIVEALKDFTLILNGKEYSCRKGKQEIIL